MKGFMNRLPRIMIRSNQGQGLVIEGSLADVSAECVLIMREIYKRNEAEYGEEVARGILMNMMIKAALGEGL